ncbi:F0F1 ATP synthase subunit delta [Candidatus Woesebacteria bacterium]|nr:F0F1 ATP synthase subunit delta [Candidatus Woesebacteria bacterium]
MAVSKKLPPIITVVTALDLTKEQTAQVKKILSERAGQAKVVFKTDPTILGGIQVKIGENRFDASLEGQLQRLQLTQDRCIITSAVPLGDSQYRKLADAITEKHGSIAIDEVVDPAVIGGIKLVIGSKEFDRTIAGRLNQLQKQSQSKL